MALVATSQSQSAFDGSDRGQKLVWVFFTIVASGSYVTGGDTLDLSGIAPAGCSLVPLLGSATIQSQSAAAGHSGYSYFFRPGTTQKNGKMQIMTTGSGSGNPLVELAAGAYPAAVSGDVIVGQAAFVYI